MSKMNPPPLERDVTRKVKKYLDTKDMVWYFKVHVGMGMTMAGVPDIIACINGHFMGIEIKRQEPYGELNPAQKLMHRKIAEDGGGAVITTYGYQDFLEKFEKFYEVFTREAKFIKEEKDNE